MSCMITPDQRVQIIWIHPRGSATTQLSVQRLAVYVEHCKNKPLISHKEYTDPATLVAGDEYPEIS